MDKQIIQNVLLTKEAIAEYVQQQRQSEAAKYGLTLEQWNDAINTQQIVTPTGSI